MAVDDGELAGREVGFEDCGAGEVDGFRLEVFVEVRVGDSADPVISCLEGCSWAGAASCGDGAAAGDCACG